MPALAADPRERAARILSASAIRRALPLGIAAVCAGGPGTEVFVVAPNLARPDVLRAARRCIADGPSVKVVTTLELVST
jgi:hypothetical protein